MRCTAPRTVGFKSDGKTIAWSPKHISKEYTTFQLPCSKCISCRLEYARQWAIRCVHEASMHDKNSFITLTYDDKSLLSHKLQYSDFQNFMKRLRFDNPHVNIGMFVTGEYGEINKRPHWHAILFNWEPEDKIYDRTNENGDKIYLSKTLEKLWPFGKCELGSVTMKSAGYCARYAAKKLVHGKDNDHEFKPISKKSSKHAIGKKWLESNYKDIFNHGRLILKDGTESGIPRYYEKWLLKNHPEEWAHYRQETKNNRILAIEEKNRKELIQDKEINLERSAKRKTHQISRNKTRAIIIEEKFKKLQKFLKL